MTDEKPYGPGRRALREPLRCFTTAARFLTIFPFPRQHRDDGAYFAAALFYFALVGALLGGVAAVAAYLLQLAVPSVVGATVLALLLSAMSGFLHIDGLADTADGFFSTRTRDDCLAIMKDSRVGVMGATAIVAILLLKTAALVSVAEHHLYGAVIVAPVAGRSAMVIVIAWLPYARQEGGLGTSFFHRGTAAAAAVSIAVLLLLMLILVPTRLIRAAFVAGLVLVLFSWLSLKRIGGATGDTVGCTGELVETALLIGLT